ncbi:hypothetical protein SAMN05660484_02136 [Eubacterium ruminantium]|uniref:Uncharacterized protein n=1 Tax=Eubacterium ruminantium TaxID=42322 RepID=A0A1T4PTQ9_9FIRM|nr:hypothetical protein SAMN05660484_02136 [Eubacterium ruminantium]SDN14641.1 hypothetical protein SAMN04490370_11139 [Eubacterium ruminantium]SJZ94955.1 hypothetical protein SAMN02745110_02125 [Eubacterium ruminantium]
MIDISILCLYNIFCINLNAKIHNFAVEDAMIISSLSDEP